MKKLLAGALFAVASLSANAELIVSDWKVEGDGQTLIDLSTGKEWIHLSNTYARTPSAMNIFTEEGHAFFGDWDVATTLDMETLFTNNLSFIDGEFVTHEMSAQEQTEYSAFMANFGYTYGLYKINPDDVAYNTIGTTGTLLRGTGYSKFASMNTTTYATFLVRDASEAKLIEAGYYNQSEGDASVPAPASLGLVGLAMMGFAVRRKKQ